MVIRRKSSSVKVAGVGSNSGGPNRRRPGRPPVHEEAWTKVTVVLFDRQIVFLDGLAGSIRARSGTAISRAQLIRALVDAVSDAEIDLTASTSEANLKATLLVRLSGGAEP